MLSNSRTDAPPPISIKYLYRPEEQQIRLILDLRLPFSNRIRYGKESKEGTVDVLETYCYLKGLPIQRRLRFDLNGQIYRVVRSGTRAVVFRNVTDGLDDTPQFLEILADERLQGITRLDVNYDADRNKLLEESGLRDIHCITTSDFDTSAVWDNADE